MPTPLHFNPSGRARRGVLAWLPRLAVFALGGVALRAPAADPLDVTLDFARAEHSAGRVTLIDIREPEEHATGVAAGAKLLPMRQLASRLGEVPNTAEQPVLLICNTQNRSGATVRALRERGYKNVRFVQGGMSEWARRGWPMVKPGAAAQPGG